LFLACALIACRPGHANAQVQGVTARQDASALPAGAQQQEAPDYNGADFTRPQRSVEFRPEYRTSSGPTSETDRWIEQLRYNAKLDLGGDWKLGFLLEIPIVEKTTSSFAPPSTSRDFVVRSMTVDFLRPARMDDVLEVVTEPEAVKGASIVLHQRVMRADEILVEAIVRVAFVSGGRARSIPNPLRIAMRADQEPRC
jgi:Thioesterase superfamily